MCISYSLAPLRLCLRLCPFRHYSSLISYIIFSSTQLSPPTHNINRNQRYTAMTAVSVTKSSIACDSLLIFLCPQLAPGPVDYRSSELGQVVGVLALDPLASTGAFWPLPSLEAARVGTVFADGCPASAGAFVTQGLSF